MNRPAKQELDFVAAQMRRLGMNPRPLMTWAIAPSAPQRCSPELLEGLAALSHKHNLPVFTHVYETRPQAAAAQRAVVFAARHPQARGPDERAAESRPRSLARPADIAMLAASGARVVHNPISNLKLKSGMAPILDLHDAGIPIALGCDNYSCAETQNIFIAMRMLCLLPAVTAHEPHLIDAAYSLRAATLNGAKAVHLEGQVGALKAGMAADLMIFDLNEPAFVPLNSAVRQIVYAEAGRAVETVFVAGGRSSATASLSPWTKQRSRRRLPNCRRACAARWRRWRRKAPTSFRRCSKATAQPGRWSPGSNATSAGRKARG